ncbi:right-handed parallel beta-helix repeat-containing protein [Roseateles oligotrophus]|uniref:Right-handed parallel beta-helix repeat-containing protein n=1 Tax=Roseateles oligotrophus TaxID=1769250 RepID=A0ABT2YMQ9_9BURK|nr:right-handed parallel beta-helix repeat-containing protein [Roseateles oligotrophus]MCV2371339.1 right-handed parallel beta-helix repeat-containing protein [Roseateles oligotrophus]
MALAGLNPQGCAGFNRADRCLSHYFSPEPRSEKPAARRPIESFKFLSMEVLAMNALRFKTMLLLVGSTLGLAGQALAVDGVVLIDQARANAGGVTPGDAAGFPVSINQPGSYRLASNLTVPDANTNAIEINAPNVTLDLNGFSILGPNQCNVAPSGVVGCSLTGSGVGVKSLPTAPIASSQISIKNGSIRGMGNAAIDLRSSASYGTRVQDINAIGNAFGIGVGTESAILRNVVTTNRGFGILAGGGSLIADNVVATNGGIGLWMLTNTNSIGYARNVVSTNGGGNINGGVNLGGNACDSNLLCP